MKKEPKNLGISQACPECGRGPLSRDVNFKGEFLDDKIWCRYCDTWFKRSITNTVTITLTKFIMVLCMLAAISYCTGVLAKKIKNNCESFQSQRQAQQAFDSDPVKYKALDKDHDGKVCETTRKWILN